MPSAVATRDYRSWLNKTTWFTKRSMMFFTLLLARGVVIMMSTGKDLRDWWQTFILTNHDGKEGVEHGISFIFGRGLLLPKCWSLCKFPELLQCNLASHLCGWEEGMWAEYWAVGRPLLLGLWPSPKHKKCGVRAKASDLNRPYWSTSAEQTNLCWLGGEDNALFSKCRREKQTKGACGCAKIAEE